jgi:hypothetical protein
MEKLGKNEKSVAQELISKHPIRDRLIEAARNGTAPTYEDALALSLETRVLGLSHAVIVLERLEEIPSFS